MSVSYCRGTGFKSRGRYNERNKRFELYVMDEDIDVGLIDLKFYNLIQHKVL